MHNMQIKGWNINYNGDFSGEVSFRQPGAYIPYEVPFVIIEQIVAEKVRAERIEKLEEATTEELLS